MSRLLHSLYARIAAVYLVLLLLLATITVWVTLREFDRFNLELEQRINRPLAGNLAMILEPALHDGAQSAQAKEVARHIAAINPTVDLRVIDTAGRLLAAYGAPDCRIGTQVDLAPIQAFLRPDARMPISVKLPCGGARSIFSVAPVTLDRGGRGYLLVALHGAPYRSVAAMLRESYIARSLVWSGALALVLALVVGLIWFAVLTRRLRQFTAEVDAFRAEGRARAPRPRGTDEIAGLRGAFNQMTQTIEAQMNALQESDQIRRELVANVSHDLRTPLTSLRGYAERMLAQGATLSSADRDDALKAIVNATEELEHLTGQLSTLSRLVAARTELRAEPFDVAELIHDILIKFRPEAEACGVALGMDAPPPLPPVVADIGLIERAVSNLIDNALHNTPAKGEVRLVVARLPQHVRIEVRDTGYGIEPDELALVTQRFYRTRRTRESKRTGSGLGLAIAQEIAALHHARLRLDSEPGRGTLAQLDLPAAGDARAS